jgi:hypothetical protein
MWRVARTAVGFCHIDTAVLGCKGITGAMALRAKLDSGRLQQAGVRGTVGSMTARAAVPSRIVGVDVGEFLSAMAIRAELDF